MPALTAKKPSEVRSPLTMNRRSRSSTSAVNKLADSASLRYLNRLSDLLFVFARVFARAQTGQEPLWQRQRNATADRDAGSGDTSDQ